MRADFNQDESDSKNSNNSNSTELVPSKEGNNYKQELNGNTINQQNLEDP